MVAFIHGKKNVYCIGEWRCLLFRPDANKFFMATNDEGKLFGCYLAYNDNGEEWVRSGKATGEKSCIGRWGQHVKKAEDDRNTDLSRFYDEFPSEKSIQSKGKIEGLFKNLTQYIAAGFDGKAVAESDIFAKDYQSGGIFFYSKQLTEVI